MIDRKQAFDLEVWYPDIVKIVTKHFRLRDEYRNEAIQEICVALLKKQRTKASAYDPDRGASPAHYVIMVARGALSNKYQKNKKHWNLNSLDQLIEETPQRLYKNEAIQQDPQKFFQMQNQLEKFQTWLFENDPEFVPYFELMRQGYKYRQIKMELGVSISPQTIRNKFLSAVKKFQMVLKPFDKKYDGLLKIKRFRI